MLKCLIACLRNLKNSRFQESYDVKYFKEIKRLKSLQKSRGVFRIQASIYDGAFL